VLLKCTYWKPDVVFVLVLVCSLQLVNFNNKAEEHYTISTTHYTKYLIGGKKQNYLIFAHWLSASNVFPIEEALNITEKMLLKCTVLMLNSGFVLVIVV
jgi:hypothetical protein